MDFITGPIMQLLWPIIAIIVALFAAWGWGAKKKAEGKAAERERARKAGDAAAVQAQRIRDKAAAEPISKQREEVSKWER